MHHSGCRAPGWNDSLLITTSRRGLVHLAHRGAAAAIRGRDEEIRVAGLLVNPSLGAVWLVRDGGGWHPGLDPEFAAAGLVSPAAGLPIGLPAAGVSGRLAGGCLGVAIDGQEETYETWAETEIGAQARRDGGSLFIVTHAVYPAQLTPAGLGRALAPSLTLTGWAPLGSSHARRL